jgi:hypothetical protein
MFPTKPYEYIPRRVAPASFAETAATAGLRQLGPVSSYKSTVFVEKNWWNHYQSIDSMSVGILWCQLKAEQKKTHQNGTNGSCSENAIWRWSKAMDQQMEQHPNYL